MHAMPRRLRAIALTVPLVALGSLSAHQLAYLVVEPGAERRSAALAATGHGYLVDAWLTLMAALAVCLTLELVLGFRNGPSARTAPAWPFALLAPAGFLVQEHVERATSGADPSRALADRAVLLGLALQLPFALASWWLARAVLRGTARLGGVAGGGHPQTHPWPLLPRPVEVVRAPRRAVLALNVAARAPPRAPSA